MRSVDNARGLSLMTQNLGIAHAGAGHHEQAVACLTESVEQGRRAGDPAHLGSALRTLGRVLLDDADRDPKPALALLHEAVQLSMSVVERQGLTETFETLAAVAGRRGDPRTGALLLGAATAVRDAAGAMLQPDEVAWVEETVTALRDALGEPDFAAATTAGRELPLDDAVALALEVCVSER